MAAGRPCSSTPAACPAKGRGRPATPRANNRGFTLLEVLVAVSLLVIALLAVYQSQRQHIAMAERAQFLTEAALLAQGRMARIDAQHPAEVTSGRGDFGDQYPQYAWEVNVLDTEMPFLKRIEMTVRHVSSPETYRLILYKVWKLP